MRVIRIPGLTRAAVKLAPEQLVIWLLPLVIVPVNVYVVFTFKSKLNGHKRLIDAAADVDIANPLLFEKETYSFPEPVPGAVPPIRTFPFVLAETCV